ncbi:hypothetical protein F443_22264 [Phytophthora nicotianae P1569]|uniref:Uncharacterized protein n=1 Tax=Phytophthora nicotianae P1569 TaxID=1317065 RepID=V9DUT2_PHYNI|nr:hypothetical protein F443_22264 [Phytophthora nicotianae P1569]
MREKRDSWYTSYGGKEWQQSERVIMQLPRHGLSERVIRAILPVGGARVGRLRKVLQDGVEILHTRRERPKPAHAFNEMAISVFKQPCTTWILEDGFPCAHRPHRQ